MVQAQHRVIHIARVVEPMDNVDDAKIRWSNNMKFLLAGTQLEDTYQNKKNFRIAEMEGIENTWEGNEDFDEYVAKKKMRMINNSALLIRNWRTRDSMRIAAERQKITELENTVDTLKKQKERLSGPDVLIA